MTRRTPSRLILLFLMFAVIFVNGDFFIAFKQKDVRSNDEFIVDIEGRTYLKDVEYRIICSGRRPPRYVVGLCYYIGLTGHRRCLVDALYDPKKHLDMVADTKRCKENPVGATVLFRYSSTNNRELTCTAALKRNRNHASADEDKNNLKPIIDKTYSLDAQNYEAKKTKEYCRENPEVPSRVYYIGYGLEKDEVQYPHACFGSPPPYMTEEEKKSCEYLYVTGDMKCFIQTDQIRELTWKDLGICRRIDVSEVSRALGLSTWMIYFDFIARLICKRKPKSLLATLDGLGIHYELKWRFSHSPIYEIGAPYNHEFLTEDLKLNAGCTSM